VLIVGPVKVMNFAHPTGNETDDGGLLHTHTDDPRAREVVNSNREHLATPKLPVTPAMVRSEDAIAALGKTAGGEGSERTDECRRPPFNLSFRQNAAASATSLSKALPQTRTLAMGRFARMAIKAKGRILFINAADVIAVEARGNYVSLLHTSNSHMLRESISDMEEKLNLYGFVRIHRSVLVNAALVEEIQPRSTGEYVLRVRGGRQFTVTRTYKNNLQLLAQLWIGTEGFASQ
jgi:hypothetical protein